jgi:ABC-2 type transport system ATP-binding protein
MTEANVVELDGLEKSFRTKKGAIVAVRGVDISIRVGEIVALLGPNGAGKSTTIDMLLGLTRPDAGLVRLLGGRPSEATSAGTVGVMLQTGSLPRDLSVHELLVLDEPTVAMDVESRHAFWTTMRQLAARGATVLFATHQLEEADSHADRAVLMAEGRVVADAPTNEIKAMVGRRTIRATLPDVPLAALTLPGVEKADRHGDTVILSSTDTDQALRALLAAFPQARGIELSGAGLEQAFLTLTGRNGGSAQSAEEGGR